MLLPLALGFRRIVPPPHRACVARSVSHGLARAHLFSSLRILADAIHHGIYFGKVNNSLDEADCRVNYLSGFHSSLTVRSSPAVKARTFAMSGTSNRSTMSFGS